MILRYLNAKEVCTTEQVSKSFNEISKDNTLWQPIFRNYFLISDQEDARAQFISTFQQEATRHKLDAQSKRLLFLLRNADYEKIKKFYSIETVVQIIFNDRDILAFFEDEALNIRHAFSHFEEKNFPCFRLEQVNRVVLFLGRADVRAADRPALKAILDDIYEYLINQLNQRVTLAIERTWKWEIVHCQKISKSLRNTLN